MNKNKLIAILIGGLFMLIFTAIPLIKMCCCLWILLGGVITVYWYGDTIKTRILPKDGALLGLWAGLTGGVLFSIYDTIGQLFAPSNVMESLEMLSDYVPSEVMNVIEQSLVTTPAGLVTSVLSNMIQYAIFGTLGGLLFAAYMRNRKTLNIDKDPKWKEQIKEIVKEAIKEEKAEKENKLANDIMQEDDIIEPKPEPEE